MAEKIKVGTIDLTPTWSGLSRIMTTVLEYGEDTAKDQIRSEFYRMAKIADSAVAVQKLLNDIRAWEYQDVNGEWHLCKDQEDKDALVRQDPDCKFRALYAISEDVFK